MNKSTSLQPYQPECAPSHLKKAPALEIRYWVLTAGQVTNFHSLRPVTGTPEASVLTL